MIVQELAVGMWFDKFNITADTEAEALSKAKRWARYHGASSYSVKVRLSTANDERFGLHDEWIPKC